MMKTYRNTLARMAGGLLLAGAFVIVSTARADAALIVYVCNDAACSGAGDTVITDDGAGDSNTAVTGQITAVVGGVGIELATSYPDLGSPSQPILNLTYSISAAGFASLGTPYLYAAQNGFTFSPGSAFFLANASNGSGSANLYTGAGTFAPPGGAPLISCPLPCATSAGVPSSPYYLAIGIQPTAGAGGAASGDATVTVPDGGTTAMLLGSVLFAFGAFRRKFNGR